MSTHSDSDPIKNSRFIRALRRKPVDRTPIWIMRQAGRYLPEYRATRKRAGDFLTLCRTPDLACEVTLQPLDRFALDAAIIFSDILVIPDAMGLGLQMEESVGPVFQHPITSAGQIGRLGVPDPEDDLGYVLEAVRTTRRSLGSDIPLIGFSGSPWTLAVYMVEGRSKTDFGQDQRRLLAITLQRFTSYLKFCRARSFSYLQAKAEARCISADDIRHLGGILNTSEYTEMSLRYMAQIVHQLKQQVPDIPIILFTKGGGEWVESIAGYRL